MVTATDNEVITHLSLQTILSQATLCLHPSAVILPLDTIPRLLPTNSNQHLGQVRAWQDNKAIKGNIKTRAGNSLHLIRAA